MSRYAHIAAEVFNQPWLITEEKLAQIATLIQLRMQGGELSESEIRARVGDRVPEREAYCISESGERVPFAAASSGAKAPRLIAVLPVYGTISPRASMFSDFSGGTSVEKLTRQFRQAIDNSDVKAVVLDIDSPGGSVYGIDELALEMFESRDKKKIVAQVNPLAASAAYYLAASAHEIVITPSGETGSIGVVMQHADISKALETDGIKVTLLSTSKYKTEGNRFEPLGDEAKQFLESRLQDYHDMFVKAVARGRDVRASVVREEFGQGRVFGAEEAKKRGMVDRIATLDETLARLGGNVSQATSMQATSVVNPATAETTSEVISVEQTNNSGAQAGAETAVAAVRAQAAAIRKMCAEHNVDSKKTLEWITEGKTAEQVKDLIMADYQRRATAIAGTSSEAIDGIREAQSAARVTVDENDKGVDKGVRLARCLRAFAAAKGDTQRAARFAGLPVAQGGLGDKVAAGVLEASTAASGGFLVPEQMSGDFIELLRPASVVRSMNPTMAPLVNGTLRIPGLAGGASASYIGETEKIPASKQSFRQVVARAKKLAALVPISNDLLRYSGPNADSIVRDDTVAAVAQAEDSAFIRSLGTEYTPKGLRYWAADANVLAVNGTVSLANVTQDLGRARLALRSANVRFLRPGWLMSPRTEYYLSTLRDGNGNKAFPEMAQGKLDLYPYRVTTQIPENLAVTGISESEIYLADFADVVLAENPMFVVEMSTEATFIDTDSTVISAFQNDLTLLKVIEEHDLVVRHRESIAVLKDVDWGV